MAFFRRIAVLAVATLFLVALAPTTQAQIQNPDESTPTTLYFHIFDTFNRFVINTQAMDSDFFEVGGTSFPTISGTPINEVTGEFDFNTIYGYSTAGPVEYDFIEEGKPRFHPERGIAQDVRIDDSQPTTVFLYVDVRDFVGLSVAPNVIADLTFRITMRTGDDPGGDFDAGELIMRGERTATLCSGAHDDDFFGIPNPVLPLLPVEEVCAAAASNPGQDILVPDSDGIIEFEVPMEIFSTIIPAEDAFNIRIDWFQGDAAGSDDEFASGYMRFAADSRHLPRLEFSIMNPVYISFIHPQVAAGTLLIHTGVNSPWGTYDVDAQNITIRIQGPSQPTRLDQVIAQNQHVHGLHHLDAEITYLWRFREEGAALGEYTIIMEVPNMAGTSTAVGRAGFIIEATRAVGIDDTGQFVPGTEEEDRGAPAAGALVVLSILGAAAVVTRRWRA